MDRNMNMKADNLSIFYYATHYLFRFIVMEAPKKAHHSQHRMLGQRTTFPKFRVVQQPRARCRKQKERNHTSETINGGIVEKYYQQIENETQVEDHHDFIQNQNGYLGLSKKLQSKRKMQAGTRHFNKSFYSKLSSKIMDKPVTFYKFGLKESDKRSCKPIFREIFKIEPERLKGSLSTTQLWDNKTSVKFLKENDMFFNKDILIQQFHSIDKEQKQKRRQIQLQKQKQFVRKYRQNLEYNRKLNQNNVNYRQLKEMNAKQACSYIRAEIDKLVQRKQYKKEFKRRPLKTSSRKIIAGMEKDYDKFDQIANKFNNQMVVLL